MYQLKNKGFLSESVINAGFPLDQREEESLKAELILNDPSWEDLLAEIERHTYLQGKVGFLLKMAKENERDFPDQVLFKVLANKASSLLSDKILRSDEFLLQRALLAFENYLIMESSNRYSFCSPNRSSYRERSENWLKVVTKPVFKNLLLTINTDVELSLRKVINEVSCGGWRQLVIENPEAIRYCGNYVTWL